MGKLFGETRSGVRKSGVLQHKSGNISETRKDRGKVTMESLYELTNALSNGTIPDPLRPPLPQDWGFAAPPRNSIAIWPVHSQGPSEQKPIKNFGEKGTWAYPGTVQFLSTPIISGTGKSTDFIWPLHS